MLSEPDDSRLKEILGLLEALRGPGVSEGTQGIVEAIADRVQALCSEQSRVAERKIRESEERLGKLFMLSPAVLSVSTLAEGRYLMVNEQFLRLTGYSADDVVGRTSIELNLWADPEMRSRMIALLREKGEVHDLEGSFRMKDGEIRQAMLSMAPVEMDGVPCLLTQIVQLTELKKAEVALRASEQHYRTLVENSVDVIVRLDREGRILFANSAASAMLSLSPRELVGKRYPDLGMTPELCAFWDRRVQQVFDSGQVQQEEFLYYGPAGPISYDWRLIPEPGSDGSVATVLSTMHDITSHKELEEERIKSSKLESLGLLAGGIAHDFNNILTAIMGSISIARMMARRQDRIDTVLAKAEAASLRARDLTQQLLTFSRGGAPNKQLASIAGIVRDSAQFAVRGARARLDFCIPDDLWSCEVDEGQISQVIHNIVLNADQAMPAGGMIGIVARNIPSPTGDGGQGVVPQVEIEIRDEGIGIPREYLDRIFDPYFSTKQQGSGLGLATAYSVIKRHGGYFGVDSQVGAGTVFRITIPASPGRLVSAPPRRKPPLRLLGRVLVMDDEEAVLDIVSQILAGTGVETVIAHDGKEALLAYKDALEQGHPFDVVIMDLTVPGGMGGLETLARLQSIDPSVKSIVSSGYSNDDVLARYRDYGFIDRLAKPYRMAELLNVLSFLKDDSVPEGVPGMDADGA